MSPVELKMKHEELHYLVEKLEARHNLTLQEKTELARLKKKKLKIKDTLYFG